jgi:hypothetical protein
MDNVSHRTTELYYQLKKESNADNWQMGLGLILFWPSLFLLEGGDGPQAAEYAQLKGTFSALQDNSVQKKCGIQAKSPDEIIKETEEKDKAEQPDKDNASKP